MADLRLAVSVLHVLVPVIGFAILGTIFVSYVLRVGFERLQEAGYQQLPTVSRRPGASSLPSGSGSPTRETTDDDDAVTPVVTKISTPRRSLILSLFSFVALCFFLDGAILVFRALRYRRWVMEDWIYAVGGWALFGSVAVAMALQRAKFGEWGRWYPRLLTWIELVAEVVQAAMWSTHLQQGRDIFFFPDPKELDAQLNAELQSIVEMFR
jgi:hypothetical protein